MIKTRKGGLLGVRVAPPSTSSTPYREYIESGHLCVEGDGLFLVCRSFLKMKRTLGLRVPLTVFAGRGYWIICTSVILGGGEGEVVFLCFCTILIAMGLRCLDICFDWHWGIGCLWTSQFGLYSYRNQWFLAALYVLLRWLNQKRVKVKVCTGN